MLIQMKRLLLALPLAILIVGCSKPAPDPEPEPQAVKVTGVTLSQKSLSLTVGQESSLTATVAPFGCGGQDSDMDQFRPEGRFRH